MLSVVGVSGLILLLWGFVRGGGIMARRADAFGVRGRMRRQGPVDRFDESVGERDRIQPGEFTLDPGMRSQAGQFTDVTSPGYAAQAAAQAERGGAMEFGTSVGAERDAGRDAMIMEIVGAILATAAGARSGYRNPAVTRPIPGYNQANPPPSPHLTPFTRRPHTAPSPFFGAKDTFPYIQRLGMGGQMRNTMPSILQRREEALLGGIIGGGVASVPLQPWLRRPEQPDQRRSFRP